MIINQKTDTYLQMNFRVVRFLRLRKLALIGAIRLYKQIVRGGESPVVQSHKDK